MHYSSFTGEGVPQVYKDIYLQSKSSERKTYFFNQAINTLLKTHSQYPLSLFLTLVLAVGLLLGGCSAKRQRNKTDLLQNISTQYNILYNANQLLQDAEETRQSSHRDNYLDFLSVFEEPTTASIQSSSQLMDSLIGKANKIINEKTASKYIDRAYFLTGRAHYEKGSYYNAAEFFSYVARVYANNPSIRQAALAWKAKSLIQIDRLTEASYVLDTAFSELESEKKSVALLFATQADYYLRTGDDSTATDMLLQAIDHSNSKRSRLRWHFLLGQLLSKQGYYDDAYLHFSKVAKSNVSYEMAFQATLNSVYIQDALNPSPENKVSLLKRMLKDDKNTEFKDQIYHQIAEVYFQAGDTDAGIANYQLALQQESTNTYQKSLTYLKLADLYFDQGTYENAKLYYDSTAAVISKDYDGYEQLMRKVTHLDTLVKQLRVVGREDTLQWLANMPEGQRSPVIDSLVALQMIKKAEKPASSPDNRSTSRDLQTYDEMQVQPNQDTEGRFYFNNPEAISRGLSEFKRRWGNRPLTDNWRTSDQSGMLTMADRNKPAESTDPATPAITDSADMVTFLRESYTSGLPTNEALLTASNGRIIRALLAVGNIYRDDLDDQEMAIKTYEELLTRYPENQHLQVLYYNLYRLYSERTPDSADFYKDKLLKDFPNSRYSQIIKDPAYLEKLNEKARSFNNAYSNLYLLYTEKKYDEVIAGAQQVLQTDQDDGGIAGQLAYLQALAIGRTDSLPAFEQVLQRIAERYSADSLIGPLVNQHLAYIENNRDSLLSRTTVLYDDNPERERFVDEPSMTEWPQLVITSAPEKPKPRQQLRVTAAQSGIRQGNTKTGSEAPLLKQIEKGVIIENRHENSYRDIALLPDTARYYFVINVMNEKVNLAPSRYGIGQFNRTQYAGRPVTHQLKLVDNECQLVYMGVFGTYEEAKLYETRIKPLLQNIMKIPADIYQTFIITEGNLGTLTDFDKIDQYHHSYDEQQQLN